MNTNTTTANTATTATATTATAPISARAAFERLEAEIRELENKERAAVKARRDFEIRAAVICANDAPVVTNTATAAAFLAWAAMTKEEERAAVLAREAVQSTATAAARHNATIDVRAVSAKNKSGIAVASSYAVFEASNCDGGARPLAVTLIARYTSATENKEERVKRAAEIRAAFSGSDISRVILAAVRAVAFGYGTGANIAHAAMVEAARNHARRVANRAAVKCILTIKELGKKRRELVRAMRVIREKLNVEKSLDSYAA